MKSTPPRLLADDLDYERVFRAAGRAYSEADDDGTVVHHPAPSDAAGIDSPEHY